MGGIALGLAVALLFTASASAEPVLLSARSLFPDGCGSGPSFPGADFETHVAVNPRNPSNVVATWIDGSGITNLVASSLDDGRTWKETTVPGLRCTGDPNTVLSGDPWLSFGPDGVLYLAGGTDVGGGDPAGLDRFVKVGASRSIDGGRTWSPFTTVAGASDFNDKPSVTADPRHPGTAYFVFTRGHHPDFSAGDLMFSMTRDGGVSWSSPSAIYAPLVLGTYPWGAVLRVLPDGALLATVMLWTPQGSSGANPAPGNFSFQAAAFRSTDGGATWSPPIEIAQVPVPRVADPDTGKTLRQTPGVALDTAPDGTAYAAWHQSGPDGRAQVVLSKSPDGGATWSTPHVVADATSDAFIPSVAVAGDGTLGVTWYDLRNDHAGDGQLTTDLWFALSRDGGASWTESHAAGPFDLRTAALVDGTYFLGDYFGLAAMPGGLGATFALAQPLSRNGPSDAFFEALPPSTAGTAPNGGGPGALKLRLTMRHRVRAGRRLRIRIRVSFAGALVPGAVVRIGRARARTGRNGVARVRIRFARAARLQATAAKRGYVGGSARLRVLPARRH